MKFDIIVNSHKGLDRLGKQVYILRSEICIILRDEVGEGAGREKPTSPLWL